MNYISMKISGSTGILYRLKAIYISPVCTSYIIQYFDLTTFSLLSIVMEIHCKKYSTCSKKSSENY